MQLLKLHFSLSLDEKWCVFKRNWATSTYYVPSNFDWSAVKNAKKRTQKYYYNCFDIYHNPLFLWKNYVYSTNSPEFSRRTRCWNTYDGFKFLQDISYKHGRTDETNFSREQNRVSISIFWQTAGIWFYYKRSKELPFMKWSLRSPNDRFFLSVNCQRNNLCVLTTSV